MPREFKVGDKVRVNISGEDVIVVAVGNKKPGEDHTYGRSYVWVQYSNNYIGGWAPSSLKYVGPAPTPLEEAQADLADAERAVLDAKKRIDDLFTPVVGQVWSSIQSKMVWTVAVILADRKEVILRRGFTANAVVYTYDELRNRCKLGA